MLGLSCSTIACRLRVDDMCAVCRAIRSLASVSAAEVCICLSRMLVLSCFHTFLDLSMLALNKASHRRICVSARFSVYRAHVSHHIYLVIHTYVPSNRSYV